MGALTTASISLRITKGRKLKDNNRCLPNLKKEMIPFLILKTNQRSNSNLISEKKNRSRTQKQTQTCSCLAFQPNHSNSNQTNSAACFNSKLNHSNNLLTTTPLDQQIRCLSRSLSLCQTLCSVSKMICSKGQQCRWLPKPKRWPTSSNLCSFNCSNSSNSSKTIS